MLTVNETTMSVEETEATDDAGDGEVNGRMCIVTRQSGETDGLIRFVADPTGRIVADLKKQLPGRGCWVTAERAVLEKAIAKKAFCAGAEKGRNRADRSLPTMSIGFCRCNCQA